MTSGAEDASLFRTLAGFVNVIIAPFLLAISIPRQGVIPFPFPRPTEYLGPRGQAGTPTAENIMDRCLTMVTGVTVVFDELGMPVLRLSRLGGLWLRYAGRVVCASSHDERCDG